MASKASVKRAAVNRTKVADRVNLIEGMCSTAASCKEVAASPTAAAALADLKARVGTAKTSLALLATARNAARAQSKSARKDLAALDKAAGTYMNAVDDVADGDPAVITRAGCVAREGQARVSSAARPEKIAAEPGPEARQAVVSWPRAAGAGAYKLRVNFTPADPSRWELLPEGTSRQRTIVAPVPGAQFLVEIAAIGAENVSDWSDPVMATAR
jgi:hypothetical protein